MRWVATAAGRLMPLDPEPDGERGNMAFGPDGRVYPLSAAELEEARGSEPLFTSHFATCPSASEHRKRRST